MKTQPEIFILTNTLSFLLSIYFSLQSAHNVLILCQQCGFLNGFRTALAQVGTYKLSKYYPSQSKSYSGAWQQDLIVYISKAQERLCLGIGRKKTQQAVPLPTSPDFNTHRLSVTLSKSLTEQHHLNVCTTAGRTAGPNDTCH